MMSAICSEKKALVTGGAGFVGRHVVSKLCDAGYSVTIVDDLSSESAIRPGDPGFVEFLSTLDEYHKVDVREFFRDQHDKVVYDLVVHLAAVVGGRLSIENNPIGVATDLSIDAEMFNWAVKTKQKKVVYFSSSAAYPTIHQTRYDHRALCEDLIEFDGRFIGQPDMTYGWSKLTGEYLARLAHQKHDLDVVCFRPFSGYGEDQNVVYPFPAILKRVMTATDTIDVWGSGDQVRDFIYIDDCVDGMLALMNTVSDGSAINLGTGIATSFKDLIATMIDVVRPQDAGSLNINCIPAPEGVFYRVADCTLMKASGYTPTTSLRQGITKSYECLRKKC